MSTILQFKMESGKSTLPRRVATTFLSDKFLGNVVYGHGQHDVSRESSRWIFREFWRSCNTPIATGNRTMSYCLVTVPDDFAVFSGSPEGIQMYNSCTSNALLIRADYNCEVKGPGISGLNLVVETNQHGITEVCVRNPNSTNPRCVVTFAFDYSCTCARQEIVWHDLIRETAFEVNAPVCVNSAVHYITTAGDFYVVWTRFEDEFAFFRVYVKSDFFMQEHKFFGIALITLEGIGFPLRAFANPKVRPAVRDSMPDAIARVANDGISNIMRLFMAIAEIETYLAERHQTSIMSHMSVAPDRTTICSELASGLFAMSQMYADASAYVDILSAMNLPDDTSERMAAAVFASYNTVASLDVSRYEYLQSLYDYDDLEESSSVILSDDGHSTHLIRHSCELMSYQWNLGGTYFVDSISMFLYSDSDGKSASGSKGLEKNLPRALGRSFMSNCMLLYAREKDGVNSQNDPITANDLDHLLSGYVVEIGEDDTGEYIDAPLSVTTRWTGRKIIHRIIDRDGDNYYGVTLPTRSHETSTSDRPFDYSVMRFNIVDDDLESFELVDSSSMKFTPEFFRGKQKLFQVL